MIITIIIVIAILVLFWESISKKSTRNYKNEIVSLGVLGTFVGIAIGLYHFDVTDIKSSMPLLLDGLKTAFITSGVGIFFSIIISIYRPAQSKKSETMSALEMVVKDFNKNLTTQFGDNFKQLNESVKAMIVWQNNYKTQIVKSEESLNNILNQLNKIETMKKEEQESINSMINNLRSSSNEVRDTLKETTGIVKDQMQLLLREANRKL
jgi:biopolymer transport protein ExbB/TolQ